MKKNLLITLFIFGFFFETKNDAAKGAVLGGAGGLAIGALANGGKGAAIGGPVGVIGGMLLGNAMSKSNNKKNKKTRKVKRFKK